MDEINELKELREMALTWTVKDGGLSQDALGMLYTLDSADALLTRPDLLKSEKIEIASECYDAAEQNFDYYGIQVWGPVYRHLMAS